MTIVDQVHDGATRDALIAALTACGGSRARAQAMLQLPKSSFFRMLAQYPDVAERFPVRPGRPSKRHAPLKPLKPLKVPLSIQRRFELFHEQHPEVYEELLRIVRRQYRGTGHIGIGCCWEVLRWRLQSDRRKKRLRLNNTWRSRYARMIALREPELATAFRTRRLRS